MTVNMLVHCCELPPCSVMCLYISLSYIHIYNKTAGATHLHFIAYISAAWMWAKWRKCTFHSLLHSLSFNNNAALKLSHTPLHRVMASHTLRPTFFFTAGCISLDSSRRSSEDVNTNMSASVWTNKHINCDALGKFPRSSVLFISAVCLRKVSWDNIVMKWHFIYSQTQFEPDWIEWPLWSHK